MAFVNAFPLAASPNEPTRGVAVLVLGINKTPPGVPVLRAAVPAPNIFQLINAVNSYPI